MLTIALAQHDFLVGDIRGNLEKALRLIEEARGAGADLLLFPEMALTGYPPEDLVIRHSFVDDNIAVLFEQTVGPGPPSLDLIIKFFFESCHDSQFYYCD